MKDLADDVFERQLAPVVMREAMALPTKDAQRTGHCAPAIDKCPRCQFPFSHCAPKEGDRS